MSKVTSNWRFTFDPGITDLVLVNYGDKIDAEPVWSLKKSLQVTQLDEAVAPFLRAAGNAVVNLTIKVYTDEVLDATARRTGLESIITVVPLGVAPLRVQISGIVSSYWTFASSFITEHAPVREIESGKARLCRSYNITATGLVRTGP